MTAPGSPVAAVHRITVPRSARYYSLGGEPAPETWVVLHGYGQLAAGFVKWFAPAAGPHRRIIAPEALNHYYTDHAGRKVGATWMTREDRDAEIADYVRYLELVAGEAGSADGRMEVHGFSQGCATAARWVALGSVRPARLVLWGGLLPPDLDLAAHGAHLNAVDLTIVMGDRDEFVSASQVEADAARLEAAGVRFTLRRFRGGHVLPWPILAELSGTPERDPA